METHSCKTYFAIGLEFDKRKNAALLKERRDCLPEEIGILNKDEVERAIVTRLSVTPVWRRHSFEIGLNETYCADVNEMIRVTLKDLFGKEERLKKLQEEFSASMVLEIVPCIESGSADPKPVLSLGQDIIAFLYESGAEVDIDYYVY